VAYLLLVAFALGLGFSISETIYWIDVFCIFGLWFYAFYLKKTPLLGNVWVATLSALVVFILNILYFIDNEQITLLSIFAFFISLLREIIKDMEDIEGDRIGNCHTLPIVFGITKSKYVVYGILLLFILFLIFYRLIFKDLQSNFVYQMLMPILLLFLAYRLYLAQHKQDFHRLSSYCKWLMLIGLGGVLFFS
jgi:4-hydroxybenzoate polyprenyltransferase